MHQKNGSSSIKLFKEEKGCKLVINGTSDPFYDLEKTEVGVNGGTQINSDKMISKGIADNKTTGFQITGSGGYSGANCRVAFYKDSNPKTAATFPVTNLPEILKNGDEIKSYAGDVSSMRIFKKPKPYPTSGKYKIKSKRTGNFCYTYHEVYLNRNKTGKVFLQCDNKVNGISKDNIFDLKLIDDNNRYYISQGGQKCKHQQIGSGYNIKCDNEGSDSSPNSKFEITKTSGDYYKIKNEGTGKYCSNQEDILMPGGGIIACNRGGAREWEEYSFVSV